MKKRKLLSLILALVLVLSLCPTSLAEGDLLFVSVNDDLPLTLSSLPIESGSVLYVPYSVFDSTPCGVIPAYDETHQTFTLFTINHRLTFDLATGTVTDENQLTSFIRTFYRNGILYVPLVFCASHFGLRVSMLESQSGYPVLRFSNGSEVFEDSLFIEMAENVISSRVEQYASGGQTDSPPADLQTPAESSDKEDEKPDEDLVRVSVYLAVTDADFMYASMQALSQYDLRAAFFFTAEEIAENPELVREVYTAGHPVGITVKEDEEAVVDALHRANEQLDNILNIKSVMALLNTEQQQGIKGYRIFTKEEHTADAELVSPCLFVCAQDTAQTLFVLQQKEAAFCLLRETSALS